MSNLLNYLNKKKEKIVELKQKMIENEEIKELEDENKKLELEKLNIISEISKLNSEKEKNILEQQKQKDMKLFIPISIFTTIVAVILSILLSKIMLLGVICSLVTGIFGTAISSTLIYKYIKRSKIYNEENLTRIKEKITDKTNEKDKIEKLIKSNNSKIVFANKEKQKIENEFSIIVNDINKIETLDELSQNNSTIVTNIINRFLNLDWENLLSDKLDNQTNENIQKVKK